MVLGRSVPLKLSLLCKALLSDGDTVISCDKSAMATIGSVPEFEQAWGSFTAFLERLQFFLQAQRCEDGIFQEYN